MFSVISMLLWPRRRCTKCGGTPADNTRVSGDVVLAGTASDALSGVASVQLQRQTAHLTSRIIEADITSLPDETSKDAVRNRVDAGVVDENVEAAELLNHLPENSFDLLRLGDI